MSICLQCGEELKTKESNGLCNRASASSFTKSSKEDPQEYRSVLKMENHCKICNTLISDSSTNQKDCSQECREKKKRTRKKCFEGVFPYNQYVFYLLKFNRNCSRQKINLISREGNEKISMLYSRYLMSVHLGRLLEKEEHVDHINNNPLDDRIENLQILTNKENRQKYVKEVLKGRLLVEMICPCGTSFIREKRNTHLTASRNSINTYCSSQCCGQFARTLVETRTIVIREFRKYE